MRELSVLGVLSVAGLGGLLAGGTPARAMSAGGITMPDSMEVQGQHLQLNGMGVRLFTFLHIRGYVAGLYVPAQSHDPAVLLAQAGAKVLRIEFVRTAGVGRVQDEYRRGHVLNCVPGCSKTEETGFGQLLDTVKPVQQGDTTTFIFLPDQVDVLFDDRKIAAIAGAEFSHHLLASFLGHQPPTTALRDGLLGSGAS
ncbi:chalcone isomerase family protein [Lichenicoccus sp.]|uniref:chalcone isomerase family protein n=1 Tax=Lichenicoccus sp. TaxID=2781899 RepID=UPI003D0E6C6B